MDRLKPLQASNSPDAMRLFPRSGIRVTRTRHRYPADSSYAMNELTNEAPTFSRCGASPRSQRLGETLVMAANERWCLGVVGKRIGRISRNPEAVPQWRICRSDQRVVQLALRMEETGSQNSDSEVP